jgi:hypothetical protein
VAFRRHACSVEDAALAAALLSAFPPERGARLSEFGVGAALA